MTVENRAKLVQMSDRHSGRTGRDRCTNRSITHPDRKLSRETRPNLDIEDLMTAPAASRADPDALAMKRVPGIFHDNKLRSVC
jgi:hypothetical protein